MLRVGGWRELPWPEAYESPAASQLIAGGAVGVLLAPAGSAAPSTDAAASAP